MLLFMASRAKDIEAGGIAQDLREDKINNRFPISDSLLMMDFYFLFLALRPALFDAAFLTGILLAL